ncbi:MAG: methyltransferase domain-containing protein [Thermofilaceae archaeon]
MATDDDFYALYYDLLYSHRDVAAEVDFLERMFREHSRVEVKRVLDVGCGTGIHSVELARRGYTVLGVDLSEAMISQAKAKTAGLENVSFMVADARRLELPCKFDAAIAMYGVISYFTSDEDALSFLRSVRGVLREGGCFIFDTWNALGVLEKRVYYETPSTHFRKRENMLAVKEELWRIDVLDQVASANISWSVIDLKSGFVDVRSFELKLRLFTIRELKHLLNDAGFDIAAMFEDYFCRPLTESSSELVVVARAR